MNFQTCIKIRNKSRQNYSNGIKLKVHVDLILIDACILGELLDGYELVWLLAKIGPDVA